MITYEDKVPLNVNPDIADVNKVTAGDMNEIKRVVNSLANLFFPIKKIVMFNDNDDHSNYLGFTWERIANGKVLVGIDSTDTDFNTIGKTGGEKEHTLTIDEMPSHTHTVNYSGGAGTSTGVTAMGDQLGTSTAIVQATGGGQSHNNMPPYQVAAFWQRVS